MNNIRRIPTYISNSRLIKTLNLRKLALRPVVKKVLINENVPARFRNSMHEKLQLTLSVYLLPLCKLVFLALAVYRRH